MERIFVGFFIVVVCVFCGNINVARRSRLNYAYRNERYFSNMEREFLMDEIAHGINMLEARALRMDMGEIELSDMVYSKSCELVQSALCEIRSFFRNAKGGAGSVLVIRDHQIYFQVEKLLQAVKNVLGESIPTEIGNLILNIYHDMDLPTKFYNVFQKMNDGFEFDPPNIQTYAIMIDAIPDFQSSYDLAFYLYDDYLARVLNAKKVNTDFEINYFFAAAFRSFLKYDETELFLNNNKKNLGNIKQRLIALHDLYQHFVAQLLVDPDINSEMIIDVSIKKIVTKFSVELGNSFS